MYFFRYYMSYYPARLAPSLSRMGFDRVYPVYYEISLKFKTAGIEPIKLQNNSHIG